jgi:hypothetical protein
MDYVMGRTLIVQVLFNRKSLLKGRGAEIQRISLGPHPARALFLVSQCLLVYLLAIQNAITNNAHNFSGYFYIIQRLANAL